MRRVRKDTRPEIWIETRGDGWIRRESRDGTQVNVQVTRAITVEEIDAALKAQESEEP